MSSRLAFEQASALAIGLMGPVFSQIDPLQVAEVDRAMRAARLYVQRLGGNHLKEGALDRLLTGYPSHDFVIDREEASDLIRTVRAPSAEEGDFLIHVEPITSNRRLRGRLLLLDEALAITSSPGRHRVNEPPDERPDGGGAVAQAVTRATRRALPSRRARSCGRQHRIARLIDSHALTEHSSNVSMWRHNGSSRP